MSEELKPCPACHESSPVLTNTGPHYYVRCPHCCMRGPEAGGPTWAAEAWNAMPRRLRWTKETPTEPGWYWHYMPPHFGVVIEFFDPDENTSTTGQWAGPIPEPEE